MNGAQLSLVLGRAAVGDRVLIYVHDQEQAKDVMKRARKLLDATGVDYRMRNSDSTRWRDIRFDGGGCLRVVSERQRVRGLRCDAFVMDEGALITQEAAPIADRARERFVLATE